MEWIRPEPCKGGAGVPTLLSTVFTNPAAATTTACDHHRRPLLPPPLPPQAALHGYQLDKAHKFAATLFDECERLAHVSEAYAEPEERVYTPGENLLVSEGGSQGSRGREGAEGGS